FEIVERFPECTALPQDGDPRHPGLKAVKQKLLEQRLRIEFGNAPFVIMIAHVKRIAAAPEAALEPILMLDYGIRHSIHLGGCSCHLELCPLRLSDMDALSFCQERAPLLGGIREPVESDERQGILSV